ncbi:carboxypeptidase-like regulatory domain-containing protein [Puia sp.]|jgi:hypothetical protein|uniref:carboxypeptidase-like regulatory domain-containing protein n=1 Tax=Puia sp. TaxID=2045100 RepID=UPI002F3E637D
MKTYLLLFFGFMLGGPVALAQVTIKGTVYDQTQRFVLPAVSVMSSSGIGTVTDSAGRYHIRVPSGDSISFSYLGRKTSMFPVSEIPVGVPFDMSLAVAIDSLPTVLVREPNYRVDSLENRKEYQKVFDYAPGYLKNMKSSNMRRPGFGVGLDLDMLLNPKANRRMLALQKRLEDEEQDKYIDHRWNRAMVRRVTGLEPPKLDSFMRQYRPTYSFVQSCDTDYEFYKYIQEWGRIFEENWKVLHKE